MTLSLFRHHRRTEVQTVSLASDHPTTCARCRGTQWMDGPPITGVVEGRPHEWTTVTPCTHQWRDDPAWDIP